MQAAALPAAAGASISCNDAFVHPQRSPSVAGKAESSFNHTSPWKQQHSEQEQAHITKQGRRRLPHGCWKWGIGMSPTSSFLTEHTQAGVTAKIAQLSVKQLSKGQLSSKEQLTAQQGVA
eukprot:1136952-Pelagomonas_calceolata.AAC.5